jgi:hypothetical protein
VTTPRFEAAPVLARLREFQRRTASYVFRRFYHDEAPADRFLVADEVGLGKTMVARGVIALALEHLQDRVERIDIVYVCSNQAIAQQNLNRLNVTGRRNIQPPTRLTLLALRRQGASALDAGKVNLISLTPGTTFDLKSSAGIVEERVALYRLLRDAVQPARGLYNLLQAYVSRERWVRETTKPEFQDLDADIAARFQREAVAGDMRNELEALCKAFHRFRERWPEDLVQRRNATIARLRSTLAKASLGALQPDLVILDEFQRFKDLLQGDTEAGELARELFAYCDGAGNRARTLLLSATPYRMLTLNHEEEGDDDHYRDFVETLAFLFGGDGAEAVAALKGELRRFRHAMLGLPGTAGEIAVAKSAVETRLRSVMVRTERVGATQDRDAMLAEALTRVTVETKDLREAVAIDRLARALDAPDIIDYWKSGPFLLSFMRNYTLKEKLRSAAQAPPPAIAAALRSETLALRRADIEAYRPVPAANGRLRLLQSETIDAGLWRVLWLPPALPYYTDAGQEMAITHPTKTLVFSAWNLAPDAIAGLLSYEAERRMMGTETSMHSHGDYSRRPRLLRFSRGEDGRLAGMPVLTLLYPCVRLAEEIDPLAIAVGQGRQLAYEELRAIVRERVCALLPASPSGTADGAEDQHWYWAALALLDAGRASQVDSWCRTRGAQGWLSTDGRDELFEEHVAGFAAALSGTAQLGRMPQDLVEALVDIALGSPAICALRALHRIAPELAWTDEALLGAAAQVAMGFRTLFNQADATALLRAGRDRAPYWRLALEHGARGNLQAVLDEYAHVLVETLSVADIEPAERVGEAARAMHDALALRPAQIEADTVEIEEAHLALGTLRLRGRFAMRLAKYEDEEGSVGRLGLVRDAFNSPFRPFVLATTAIGQEGLDFHCYCRRVCHWNLPSNPVDLEQREGRVQRYKGLAVRANLTGAYGIAALGRSGWQDGDPWSRLFALAKAEHPDGSDLVPFWLCDGAVKVERCIPLLPYSVEETRLARLKRSLTLYRRGFGHPRQDDLLALLDKLEATSTVAWQIDLQPPR